jgi:hypothetical protein
VRAAVALLLVCGTAHAEELRCPKGARTTLAIQQAERAELLRPDEAIGGDVLILRAGKKELLHTVSHDFHWMCLAYSKKRGHLVGSRAPLDGVLVLRTVGYLAEDSDTIEASAFTRDRFHAYAALPSADGRFVAFIGGRDDVSLYVLDTTRDTIRKLGPAPAQDWSAGYAELARTSWRFEGATLVVSYPKDKRGKARALRRFKV